MDIRISPGISQRISCLSEHDPLNDWASELGCTAEELLSAMEESGRSLFEFSPSEQFELDLGAPAIR